MSALKLLLPALATVAVAPSLPADASTAQGTIVIEGQRLHSQVDDFVRKLTPAHQDQLERFEEVCPAVIGLSPDLANEITSRIRQVAYAVSATVAKPNCSPNLVLQVVHDKRTAIQQLRDALPGLFSEMSSADLRKMVETPGPTAAWHLSSRLGADGMPLAAIRVRRTDGSNDAVPLVRSMSFLSRVNMQVIRKFDTALVIVEARALDQVDTRQLADYTAMRALASTGYADANLPARSILQLFNEGTTPLEAPESVTWWDVAFLKSLYRSSNRVEASDQRAQISKMMASELNRVPVEQR